MRREILYETEDKLKRTTYVLETKNDKMIISEIEDYEKFICKHDVILKANMFMKYYERYYTDGSSFSNGIICKLRDEKLREVEHTIGATMTELFSLAAEKIRKGNVKAFDGLWFTCRVLDPYQRPYWVELIRKYILS